MMMPAPTTLPTPIPTLAPSLRSPPPLSAGLGDSVPRPGAQYPVPSTSVHRWSSSQQPAPSSHRYCDVAHPSAAGVSAAVPVPVVTVIGKTHPPSARHSESYPQQPPPRLDAHRYSLVREQPRGQQAVDGPGVVVTPDLVTADDGVTVQK